MIDTASSPERTTTESSVPPQQQRPPRTPTTTDEEEAENDDGNLVPVLASSSSQQAPKLPNRPQQQQQQQQNHSDNDHDHDEEEEEESTNYFLSEPSLSDHDSGKVLAPHRVFSSEDEMDRYRRGRRRINHQQLPSPAISPGNTSLSSWENSPAVSNKKVLLQFVMPESKFARQRRNNNDSHVRLSTKNPHELTVQVVNRNKSSMTTTEMPQWDDGGAAEPSTSLPPRRREPKPLSSSEASITPTSGVGSSLQGSSQHTTDSLALSDSDLGQSEQDETKRPPRSLRKNAHRRTRSGDDVAASLATGGKQYRSHVYFPDDQDEEEEQQPRYSSQRHRSTWSSTDNRETWMGQMRQLHSTGSLLGRSAMSSISYQQSPGQSPLLESHESLRDGFRESPRPGSLLSVTESPDEDGEGEFEDAYSSEEEDDGGSELPQSSMEQLESIYEEDDSRRNQARSKRRLSPSPFANIGKKSAEKARRSVFLPMSYENDPNYATFICPRCNTRQREFFTVENAAGHLEGPGSYLALYFAIYVMCSLFIFGLEEGWVPLDCIYFAVITLTTAGLGDYVPTSNANKIICSIFIYFGVACIGLLLGSYIAGMLDDKAYRDQKQKQAESCPNCARIRTMKEAAEKREREAMYSSMRMQRKTCFHMSQRMDSGQSPAIYTSSSHHRRHHQGSSHSGGSFRSENYDDESTNGSPARGQGLDSYVQNGMWLFGSTPPPPPPLRPPTTDSPESGTPRSTRVFGSPLTRQILGRQKHTRHQSIDVGNQTTLFGKVSPKMYGSVRRFSEDLPSFDETPPPNTRSTTRSSATSKLRPIESSDGLEGEYDEDGEDSSSYYSSSYSSTEEIFDGRKSKIQTAKYVFLTLRTALINSMVIIAVGCFGFWVIEGFSIIDSWYFTTVLLTTVGYGDIVPVTKGGKLFTTVYILVAGTILLNNMSTISMIPLELRRRRIERAILTQFGEHLDDAALRELATGPLIQRLRLSANRTDGLDECTREMFALAMLVRLGKVTEQDIRETFASFRRLDVNNEGVLNSKSIIAAMIKKHRIDSMGNLSTE